MLQNDSAALKIDSRDDECDDTSFPVVFHGKTDTVIGRNYWRVFIGGMVGFGLCVEFFKQYLGILPAPRPALVAAAAVGIAVALRLPRRRLLREIVIDRDVLGLIDLRGETESIPLDRVTAVTGEAGLTFDGGEILIWKWVRVITHDASFRLRLDEQSEHFYRSMLQRSGQAIGISYIGEVHLPTSSQQTRREQVEIVEKVIRRQVGGTMAWSGGLLLISAASIIGLVYAYSAAPRENHDDLAQLSIFVIVVCAAAVLLAAYSIKRGWSARRTLHRLREGLHIS